jgi:hypothetical protein
MQMDFNKTKVLPLDPAKAQEVFRQAIYDEPFVLFVVLGSDAAAETVVSKAGKLAGSPTDPRWVVWVRRPTDVAEQLGALKGSPEWKASILNGTAQAFTTSFDDEIRDVIGKGEVIDNTRVFQAFARAEAA